MKLVQTYSALPDLKRLIRFKFEYLHTWFTVFTFEMSVANPYLRTTYPIPRRTTWSDFSETA